MPMDLDPRFTFEALVVGPANRLAAAAAERVAESPGTTYSPLYIYSPSGLGKTHVLTAIGHRARKLHDVDVVLERPENLADHLSVAPEDEREAVWARVTECDILLLDDVQLFAGADAPQERLIEVWDALEGRGAQVVVTADQAPSEIDGLLEPLVARLSDGLIVDIGPPDPETLAGIARRKSEERGWPLPAEVCDAVAATGFTRARELQGAMNHLIALQVVEDREVRADEVEELLTAEDSPDDFGEFLSDITGPISPEVEAQLIRGFAQDVARLREIGEGLMSAEPAGDDESVPVGWDHPDLELVLEPEDTGSAATSEPDAGLSLDLGVEHTLVEPPPVPPPGPGLELLDDGPAVQAAQAVARAGGAAHNPLYVMGPDTDGNSALLLSLGNTLRKQKGLIVAYMDGAAFVREVTEAAAADDLETWRARFRHVGALLIDGLDALRESEPARQELLGFAEEMVQEGRQLATTATARPRALGMSVELAGRLESGRVVELPESPVTEAWEATMADMSADAAATAPPATEAGQEAAEEETAEEAPPEEAVGAGEAAVAEAPEAGPVPEEPEPEAASAPTEAAIPEAAAGEEAVDVAEAATEKAAEAEAEAAAREAAEEETVAAEAAEPAAEPVEAEPAPVAAGAEAGEAAEGAAAEDAEGAGEAGGRRHWLLSPEKVLWEWPYLGDWIEEELD